jgi:hypothetical protein
MSAKQVWSQHLAVWQPSCFFSATWCGEAFHRLGVEALLFLGDLFLPSVAPAFQQYFLFTELSLSASAHLSLSWIPSNIFLIFFICD